MSEDHYFTASPASAAERRSLTVPIAGREARLEVAAGVFSGTRLDLGTSVLLRAEAVPAGDVLVDLGCGWGPIALTMAALRPEARVWAIDVNERALDLTRRNAASLARERELAEVTAVTPEQFPDDLAIDELWSNPPIRIGKQALHDMLATWLPRLRPGGVARLVVQRNLGADSLATWIGEQADAAGAAWGAVERESSAKGFRVLRFTRG